ncbi:heme exporter protein C [Anseongella ginsenosidimutans]|uniref:Heme exporter protein C n=1 Tax=Anseongella ginsenosidimutans TaxID=496056 RepID=A0A4R3KRC5_9SPHI|nr:cytochrome c biogenesis protein CcsA [Anseongella ginsenosidimutans]QEC52841.1 ABC transporter permease [Anseongella ginsenosidimutans]TCS87224.1 heme exporter protein C [Anseongella ginsenosidimutans]
MKGLWWKTGAVILILYSIIGGLLLDVPRLPILNESIRNLHFHVTMWFAMIALFSYGFYASIKYLSTGAEKWDLASVESNNTGVFFGVLGLLTGMVWAKYTWGEPWPSDPKLNSAAIAMLVYLAYLVLRGSVDEDQKRGRISAVYNIFAYPIMIALLFILPRMTDSLHPGNGGNPGFNSYDLDSRLRAVFYPAVLGWILLGIWIMQIRLRIRKLESAS